MNDHTEHGPPEPPPPPERTPRRKWWWLVLSILGGFIVLMMVLFLAFRWSLNRAVDAELVAIREAGYPVTAQELDDWYPDVPEDQNAALVLIDAFDLMRLPTNQEQSKNLPLLGDAELPPPTDPLPGEQMAAIEALLIDNAEALELLHRSAAMERSRYPVDLSLGLDALFPYLRELRHGGDLLVLEAIWRVEHNEAEEAVRSVRSILGLARSLENEPMLISQVVRLTIQALAVQTLERVVHQVDMEDAAMAGLIDDLADAEHPSAIKRGIIGERAFTGSMFVHGFADLDLSDSELHPWWFRGVAQLDHLTYLDVMGEHVAASKLPLHEQTATFEEAAARADDLSGYAKFTEMLLPTNMHYAARVGLLVFAQLRTARTALAVERYRLADGELPDDLSALTPEFINALPADPFTGKPLKYQKSEEGYTVYSVGLDEMNDGGTPHSPDHGTPYDPGFDVPFTVKR